VPMWFEKPSQGFRLIATVKDEESRTENPQALVQKSSRGCIGRIGRGGDGNASLDWARLPVAARYWLRTAQAGTAV